MKKFSSVLLAVLLCICFFPVFASAANEDIIASVKDGTAQIGDTITLPISLDVNKGFVTLGLKVSYDADVLEIVCPNHVEGDKSCSPLVEKASFASGNQGFNSQFHTNNPYRIQWAYGVIKQDICETGQIASITFKVKASAKLGETKVRVDIDQASCYSKERRTFAGGEATVKIVCATHSSDAGAVTQNPTCTEKGVKSYNCTVCGTVASTEDIAPLGHNFGEWTKTKEPTCTESGTETRVCSNDSNHIETKEIKALEHSYGGWQIIKEPTLTSEGKRTGKCSICGNSVTETMPKLTTTIEGDKLGLITDTEKEQKPADGFKVDSTKQETFSGYVKGEIKETFPNSKKPITVGNKTVAAIYNIILRDTDNDKIISGDKVVVLTIPVKESILSAYKNIVLVREDANGNYVIIKDAKLSNGKFVVTGKYSSLSKLLIAGEKKVVDETVNAEQEIQSDVSSESTPQPNNNSSNQEQETPPSKGVSTTVLAIVIAVVLAAALVFVFISMRKRF